MSRSRDVRGLSTDYNAAASVSSDGRWSFLAAGLVVGLLLSVNVLAFEVLPATGSLLAIYYAASLAWLALAGFCLLVAPKLSAASHGSILAPGELAVMALTVGGFLVAAYFSAGFFFGFGRSPFAHSGHWLFTNLLWAGAPWLAAEAARNVFLRAAGERYLSLSLILSSLLLAAARFPLTQFGIGGLENQAQFWATSFLPLVATGLIAGYYTWNGGLRCGLLVSGPMAIFAVASPILPAAAWPMIALMTVCPAAAALWISESILVPQDEEGEEALLPAKSRGWSRLLAAPSMAWLCTLVASLVILWFSFGFFGYIPAFVPSHSMEPLIRKGDVVLVRPVSAGSVRVGDVILYEAGGGRVLHRVVEIKQTQAGREFITKGDNNNALDLRPVADRQIMGRIVGRAPYLGWIPIKTGDLFREVR